MDLKRTIITTEAEQTTANARYAISYTTQDGTLQRVHARVYIQTGSPDIPEREVGLLAMANGYISSQDFPFSAQYMAYMGDFVQIVQSLQEANP